MRLGTHMMTAGGLAASADKAKELGCETVQIFSRSPRGWSAPPLNMEEVAKFQANLKKNDIWPLAIHASYLINPASPDPKLFHASIGGLVLELSRAEQIGADGLVIHLGSHRGSGMEAGIQKVAKAVNETLKKVKGTKTRILLENSAGQGNVVGGRFEEIKEILALVEDAERVGVCFDTCHAFQAGYDLSDKKKTQDVINELDQTIGWDRVFLIHGNDAKAPLGAGLDRHWHIGEGEMGTAGFEVLLNSPKLKGKALILETPKDKFQSEDIKNLTVLRKLMK